MNKMRYQQRETIQKNQTDILELKSTITELKNSLEGINIRLDQAEERISEFEDSSLKLFNQKNERKKNEENEKSLRDLMVHYQMDPYIPYGSP